MDDCQLVAKRKIGGTSCSVACCPNFLTRKACENKSFHKLPQKNDPVYRIWIHRMRRPDDWIPTESSTVGSDHFVEDDFAKTTKRGTPAVRRLLKKGACLTRFDCMPVSSRPAGCDSGRKRTPKERVYLPEKPRRERQKRLVQDILSEGGEVYSPLSPLGRPALDLTTDLCEFSKLCTERETIQPFDGVAYCVPFCPHYRNHPGSQHVTFHQFVLHTDPRYPLWLERIRRVGPNGEPWEPADADKVCSEHFEADDYETISKLGKRMGRPLLKKERDGEPVCPSRFDCFPDEWKFTARGRSLKFRGDNWVVKLNNEEQNGAQEAQLPVANGSGTGALHDGVERTSVLRPQRSFLPALEARHPPARLVAQNSVPVNLPQPFSPVRHRWESPDQQPGNDSEAELVISDAEVDIEVNRERSDSLVSSKEPKSVTMADVHGAVSTIRQFVFGSGYALPTKRALLHGLDDIYVKLGKANKKAR